MRAVPYLNAAGTVVRWYGTCTDIEEQKQAEANLRRQWQTSDTALSHTPDCTYIFDLNGDFLYANASLLNLLGRPYEEVIGRSLATFISFPRTAEKLNDQLRRVIETKQPLRDHLPFTVMKTRPASTSIFLCLCWTKAAA